MMIQPNNAKVVTGRDAYNPNATIKAISEIGYKEHEAIADLVDNPIEAGATEVEILVHPPAVGTNLVDSKITIADNGQGMSPAVLEECLRLGTERPRDLCADKSLGEFGLGAKAASLSLGNTMTYVTAQNGRFCTGQLSKEHISEMNEIGFWITPAQPFEDISNLSDEMLDALMSISKGNIFDFTGTVLEISDLGNVKKSKNAAQFAKELCKPLGDIFSNFLEDTSISVSYRGKKQPSTTIVRPVTLHDLNPKEDGYKVNTFGEEDYVSLEVEGETVRAKVIYFEPPARGKKKAKTRRGQGLRIFRGGRLMNHGDVNPYGVWNRNDVFTGLYIDLLVPGDTKLLKYNVKKASPELNDSLVTNLKGHTTLARAHVAKSAKTRAKERNKENVIDGLDKKISETSKALALGPAARDKIDNATRKTQTHPAGRGPDLKKRRSRSYLDADYGYNMEISSKFVESELDPDVKIFDVKTPKENPNQVTIVYNSENEFISRTLCSPGTSDDVKSAIHLVMTTLAIAELDIEEDDNLRRSWKKIKQRIAGNLGMAARNVLELKKVIKEVPEEEEQEE